VAAYAQDASKAEVSVMYSDARYVPSLPNTNNDSLNGAGGSVDYNFMKYVGIKAEFIGYGSNTQTFNFGDGNSAQVQGNLFTYLFGPQIGIRSGKFRPYGHALFGGAHSNVYANAQSQCEQVEECPSGSAAPSSNTFAMAFGGGLDIMVHKNIAFRPVQVDYLYTHFTNNFTNQNNQNSFRYSAGIVFNF
jgi:opacity protein-like surface antigen